MAENKEVYTYETMPWAEYDSMRGSAEALNQSAQFLEEHPEAVALLQQREMNAMAERRQGLQLEVTPGVSEE